MMGEIPLDQAIKLQLAAQGRGGPATFSTAGDYTAVAPPASPMPFGGTHMRDLWRQAMGFSTSDQALTGGGAYFAPPGYKQIGSAPDLGVQLIQGPDGRLRG